MTTVALPAPDGTLVAYRLPEPVVWRKPSRPLRSRVAYAAAHVIPHVLADNTPGAPAVLDWDATLAYRHELWSYGLGVADAMDTAQRGMGLDWSATQELVKRVGAEASSVGGRLACGAGTDQLDLASVPSGRAGLDALVDAYREQVDLVQAAGATPILMASRALAALATTPEDYRYVYDRVLADVASPVVLHWLGTMFDPALTGYWGSAEIARATEVFADLVADHADRVDGVKVSLLDARHETELRARLARQPHPVRLYTGDDFNYPQLIHGDGHHHSDALLGVFAAIYPAASAALQAYDRDDDAEGLRILRSTQELGRHLFSAPTYFYKTGIAFLSWLNGRQEAFVMVGGLQSGRSLPHLVRTFRLAAESGLLLDPDLAAHRMRGLLDLNGVRS